MTRSPFLTTSSVFSVRPCRISEMCTSAFGARHDLDERAERRRRSSPCLRRSRRPRLRRDRLHHLARALHRLAADGGDRDQCRESSTVSSAPVSSWMPRIVLPFGPIRSPIFSGLICSVTMRGAYVRQIGARRRAAPCPSRRGCAAGLRFACASASFMILRSRPSILMSIWIDVMPFSRAGDLEVHVAEVILGAEDVGEDRVLRRLP